MARSRRRRAQPRRTLLTRVSKRLITRDESLQLKLARAPAERVDGQFRDLVKLVVSYHEPDFDDLFEIFDMNEDSPRRRADSFQIEIQFDAPAPGEKKRQVDFRITQEETAADPGPETLDGIEPKLEIALLVGNEREHAIGTISLRPREGERIFVTLEDAGDEFRLSARLSDRRSELGWRWVSPAKKIETILEHHYASLYAPQRGEGNCFQQFTLLTDWDRHAKKTGNAVCLSRSGSYEPGFVCVTFVNVFLCYWFCHRAASWYGASDRDAVAKRFASSLDSLGNTNWRDFATEYLQTAPTASTKDIYFCGSKGHVWLIIPLGGVYRARKKYIYGYGSAWDRAHGPPPSYFDQDCELGWYMVHASGPGAGIPKNYQARATKAAGGDIRVTPVAGVDVKWSTLTIFTGPAKIKRKAMEGGIVQSFTDRTKRLVRPVPSGYATTAHAPETGRYSTVETYATLGQNIQARMDQYGKKDSFVFFAGTPLAWMNCRLWTEQQTVTIPARKRRPARSQTFVNARYAEALDESGGEIPRGFMTWDKSFSVWRLKDVTSAETGWLTSRDAPWQKHRDVRPLVWVTNEEDGLRKGPP